MPVLLFIAGCWVLAFPAVARAEDPVKIVALSEREPAIELSATQTGVILPDCRGVVWERFDASVGQTGAFVPVSTSPCGVMTAPTRLDEKPLRFAIDGDPKGAQVLRAVVVVGMGCRESVPFELAGCKQVLTVNGPTINVRSTTAP